MADRKRELHELRQNLAELDGEIVALLDKRASASRRAGALRGDQPPSLPLNDRAAIRELVARSTGDMPHEALRDIFSDIYAACLAVEMPVTVAFAGVEGGPAHAAGQRRFGPAAGLKAAVTTPLALEQVSRKGAEFAVIPFESSVDGTVGAAVAALVASELRIVEMIDESLDLHLLCASGVLSAVEKVAATPIDRAGCALFLRQLPRSPIFVDVASPLDACRLAAADSACAAIAVEHFAAGSGLQIAQRNILDAPGPRMRFAIVGTRPAGRTGQEVTSFVFSVRDAAGSLLEVLNVFAQRGINLTRIHSHPVSEAAWTYLFCAEATGHFTDRPLVIAFEEMKRITRFFRVLGSYALP